MRKIAIITSVSGKSARTLSEALNERSLGECKAERFKPYQDGSSDFTGYDFVLSLGCSASTRHKHRLNTAAAVKKCVSKPATFDALKAAGVNTVDYVLRKQDVPKKWSSVVIRQKQDGRKAEGLSYCDQYLGQPIPDGELFTEWFDNKYEYRIMVFMGKIVGRYFKHEHEGDWHFLLQPARGFELMDEHCLKAAKTLGIDYVGFDVAAKTKKDFVILEANSGAALTDEVETAIVEYFMNV